MDQLYDAMLVVISGCSALYCYMLGRRLRSMHNLRKGMGKAVVDFTQSVSVVEANARKLNRETSTTIAELGAMLAKIDAYENKVDVLLETMEQQARETWKDHKVKADEASLGVRGESATLKELMVDAKSLAGLMNNQLIALAEASDRQAALLEATRRTNAEAQAARAVPPANNPELAATKERNVAELRAMAEARVNPQLTGQTRAQRPWANAAAAASAGDAFIPSTAQISESLAAVAGDVVDHEQTPRVNRSAVAQRVAALAKRLAEKKASQNQATAQTATSTRKPNPFVREAVKRAGR